jgi:uncharacterized protein
VIGMLHVPPLPGAPRFDGNLPHVREFVLQDADALVTGGVDGLLLENFGDAPFTAGRVPAYALTHLTVLAWEIKRRWSLPLGINVLRNDGLSALAVAHAVGADFIRVNVLCGALVTDQGIIEGIAYDLLRERAALGAAVSILADVRVKHAAPLAPRPLAVEVRDTIQRGLADALVVSGVASGDAPDREFLATVRAAAGPTPILVGSGVAVETASQFRGLADGFVVGTAFKRDGVIANPVDPARVARLKRVMGDG